MNLLAVFIFSHFFFTVMFFIVFYNILCACALQCAEGFLQAALKADSARVMQESRDGETPAKKSCNSPTSLVSKAKLSST